MKDMSFRQATLEIRSLFILNVGLKTLGFTEGMKIRPIYKPMLGARAGSEGTSEQFAPLLARLNKVYTHKN